MGFGRKTNPRDKQGNIMKCHGCRSEYHLMKRCPQAQKRKGDSKGGGKEHFVDTPANDDQHQAYQLKALLVLFYTHRA